MRVKIKGRYEKRYQREREIESLKMREINSYTTGGFTCIPLLYPINKFKTQFLNVEQHETFANKKTKK